VRLIRAIAIAAVTVAALVNTAIASADSVVGQTAPPTIACTPGTLYQAATAADPSYNAHHGVITRWSVQTDANVAPIKLKVLHALGGGSYRVVSESEAVTPDPNSTATFLTRMVAGEGNYLAISVLSGSADCRFSTANHGDAVRESTTVDPPVGSTITLPTSHPNSRLDVSAVVEPDLDGDGYGDTTQDSCSTDKSTQGACTADLSIKAVSIFDAPRVGHTITWSVTVTNNSPTASFAELRWRLPAWVRIDSVISPGGPCQHFRDLVANEYVATCQQTFVPRSSANFLIRSTPLGPGFIRAHGSVPPGSTSVFDPDPSNNDVTARRLIVGIGPACRVTLDGGAGNDRLVGSLAGDRIRGNGGNDRIFGYGGRDCLSGGAGDDSLYAGRANDVVHGGSGDDLIVGGSGHDHLYGGAGDDVIRSRDGERDWVRCGSGFDTVHADRYDHVSRNCERVIRA
jgi:Ca2+-binding RTX toxin-like protein